MTNIGTSDMSLVKDISAINVYGLIRKLGFPHQAALKLVNNINRDNARTPMQWNAKENAGFTSGKPWLTINPNYTRINVENSISDETSIYHFYKQLIKIKKEISALCYGDFQPLFTSGKLMAFLRTFGNDEYTIILNMSKKRQKNPLFLRGEVVVTNYDGHDNYENKRWLEPFEGALIKTR